MSLGLNIRHDLARLEADLGLYAAEKMKAGVRAINRTLTTVRAEGAREMAKEYPGIQIKMLKSRLRFQRATQAAPRAVLEFSAGRIPLYGNFGMQALRGRKNKKFGVRFSKLPWRIETVSGETVSAEMLARVFRNRSSRTGAPLIFSRHTNVRTSHEVLIAPGLNSAFVERKVGDLLLRVGRQRFAVALVQESKFQLSKRNA